MSRYRNDRDDDYYGGGGERSQRARRSGGLMEGRDETGRGEYYGGRDRYDSERSDYGVESGRGGRDYDDYGRGAMERYGGRDEGRGYPGQRRGREGGSGASRSHVRCRDIMTRDVTVATRDTTLAQVAAMMRDEDTGVIPVVDRSDAPTAAPDAASEARSGRGGSTIGNGKLVGLITDRDVVVRAIAEGKDANATRAEEIMTTDVHSAQPNDRVIDAIRKMGDKQVRRIPVVDRDGSLRGIISMADVALETEEDRELADALEEISSGSSFWNRMFG